jgi:uncharacterized membrane protein YgdD (TMEM256/DUF423 family)
MRKMRLESGLAALAGLASVAFGAFAAHAMKDPKGVAWLHTASQYAGVHALAVLACSGLSAGGLKLVRGTGVAFLIGIALFSGSLVAMAFGAPRWLGAVTPLGGLALMIGWALLALAAFRRQRLG